MAAKADAIRSVAFVSLGCPKNLVDSERMLGLLAEDGLTITSDAAKADAIVVNTCGFLEASKTESLQAIRDSIHPRIDAIQADRTDPRRGKRTRGGRRRRAEPHRPGHHQLRH